MQDARASFAQRNVPRYTSYPTAPHFRADFSEAAVRGWLADLPADPVSVYVHVPFCRQMCWYCGCNMKLAVQYGPLRAYVETLAREIDLLVEALPDGPRIGHLHWGGGTPTALEPEDLAAIMARLRGRFGFVQGAELAIESDPRTLTAEMAQRIGALGFTRASFGVQEFDPAVQAAINRVQPPEMVAQSVRWLRGAGVGEINFDLIYGLPHQTVATLIRSIRIAAEMGPGRIALFGYAHVPWQAKNQRLIPEEALPGPELRAEQAAAAAEELRAQGYLAIGIDHFALPDDPMARAAAEGRLRRNFQGYTTDQAETLLALGATSIGRSPAGWWQNIGETRAWARAIGEGRLPIARGVALDRDDRMRGWLIERVMCDGAADIAEATRRFDADPGWADASLARLREFEAGGIVVLDGTRLSVTDGARGLTRVVASAFDAYLDAGSARYSAAL